MKDEARAAFFSAAAGVFGLRLPRKTTLFIAAAAVCACPARGIMPLAFLLQESYLAGKDLP
jgi:hypothetical protein